MTVRTKEVHEPPNYFCEYRKEVCVYWPLCQPLWDGVFSSNNMEFRCPIYIRVVE